MRNNVLSGIAQICTMIVICLLFGAAVFAEKAAPAEIGISQTASGRSGEAVISLSEGWRFGRRIEGEDAVSADDSILSTESYDDSTWELVNLPHTWNVADGADGNGRYERTAYWYRKTMEIDPAEDTCYFLEFTGANQQTDLYVNGQHIRLCGSDEYTHKGGYTAFRYEITSAVRKGSNLIAVRVDNTRSEEIAPISGDFNIYGGIYRQVNLITVDEVHFDLSDNGSSGLFLTTPNIRSREKPEDFGTLNIRTEIVNDSDSERTVTVTAHIDGDNVPEDIVRQIVLPAKGSAAFDETAFIPDPHLWKGIDYSGKTDSTDIGYTYRVTLTISEGERVLDTVSDRVGFRYIYVDRNTGFYLNGESWPLHGVNRHQFREGVGSALCDAEHLEDMELIMEIGANSVRLCHYPQCDYVYNLCDENGIIVWTEIPLVNDIGKEEDFTEVTKTQLTELIRQQYNRPSICFWGLENELKEKGRSSFSTVKKLISTLDDLAHEEDSSGRYTTQAVNTNQATDRNNSSVFTDAYMDNGWKSDLIAWNLYPGWYVSGNLEEEISKKSIMDSRPMALSEYGYGASAEQHELNPELGKNGLLAKSGWHPEEYQSLMHEKAVRCFTRYNYLWATYVWSMFDFDVDARNEGSRPGQNDKGLVTNDRRIKKDSFYLYKANWNQTEPFVHITSSRYTERDRAGTYVKVYSNCESVELEINGTDYGKMKDMGNGIFLLEDIRLDTGENLVHVTGVRGEELCGDDCRWSSIASASTELESATLFVSSSSSVVELPDEMTLGELKEKVISTENATYKLFSEGVEVDDDTTVILPGMKIIVTAENGENTKEYSFIRLKPLTAKKIWATSNEEGNTAENAVDQNNSTRWVAADNSYPQSITVDLGEIFSLNALNVDWFTKNNRYYSYTVEISEDGETYELAADCSENRKRGRTCDDLHMMKGRFVRVNVLSCSDMAGYAAMFEMQIGS